LKYPSRKALFQEKFKDLFFDSNDKDIFFELLRRNGNVKSFETRFKQNDGDAIWVAITVSCVFTKTNQKCLEGIIQNISGKKEAQDKLLMEKDFLEGLFNNIPDAVYFKDKNNRIVKVNKFYIKGTGLKKEKILGKTDFDFFPYKQAKEMFEDDNVVLNSGKPIVGRIEKTLLPNGSWNQVITTKIAMHDKFGKIIGTMGTTRDMTSYANLEQQRLDMVISALEVLGKALEMRDPYTFSHTRHVANIAEEIAKALGWSQDRCLAIKVAGELHDLGKISIPLDILNKPGRLNRLEYSLIQQHAENCYNLIKDIEFPFPLAEIIYQHHELLDGSGYPRHLKGSQILPEAQILAVSDVLEAMTHHRPYREALGIKAASKELRKHQGTKYNADIVECLFGLVNKASQQPFWLND
jgi:PAS domain S-box-containing protein/putative nucleotidyltransferase with HDIG domain